MRHQKRTLVLDRATGPRRALLRGLARNLLLHSRIVTTPAKAKATQRFAERLITRGRHSTLTSRRYLIERTGSADLADHILKNVAPKYVKRDGGYTRLIKTNSRAGDGADQVILELV